MSLACSGERRGHEDLAFEEEQKREGRQRGRERESSYGSRQMEITVRNGKEKKFRSGNHFFLLLILSDMKIMGKMSNFLPSISSSSDVLLSPSRCSQRAK